MQRLSAYAIFLSATAILINCGGSDDDADVEGVAGSGGETAGAGGTSTAGQAGAAGEGVGGTAGGTGGTAGATAGAGGTGGNECEYVSCNGVCCDAGEYCDNGTCTVSTGAYDGYTLYSPNGGRNAYLVDMSGNTVHTWDVASKGGYSSYLLENGNLLWPAQVSTPQLNGGAYAGLLQEIDWDGNVVWEFEYSSSTYLAHHDIEPMPNGNILLIAWEVKSSAQATAAGRTNASTMWPTHVVEIAPSGSSGEIVWSWHAWDHLIQDANPSADNYGTVGDHPELIDINLNSSSSSGPPGPGGGSSDWLHMNGISYNAALDQIAISSHNLDEVFIIDHSTTTAEAAGHTGGNAGRGGDILYRWGCPSNYDAPGTCVLDVVHSAYWAPPGTPGEGNLMMFNNNEGAHASQVLELSLPLQAGGSYALTSGAAYEPSTATWSYEDSAFYSNHLGGVQRLPNGNTLIIESTDDGHMFEVTADGSMVWEFEPHTEVARALRYPADYPGLSNL